MNRKFRIESEEKIRKIKRLRLNKDTSLSYKSIPPYHSIVFASPRTKTLSFISSLSPVMDSIATECEQYEQG